MTRSWTPHETNEDGSRILHVKRACENCGRVVGDVTAEELQASMRGEPLPDVAGECGCAHAMMQIALFCHARDEAEYGTAPWEELGEPGQEAYLREAAAVVRAMVRLGWAPESRTE